MGELPAELPPDILNLLELRTGPGIEVATKEIARRYGVSQIEALRSVNNALGGVAANARLHEVPPDVVFSVEREATHRRYRIELYRAPLESTMTDEYRLVETDTVDGKRLNTVHVGWNEAASQAQRQFGIDPGEWTEETTT